MKANSSFLICLSSDFYIIWEKRSDRFIKFAELYPELLNFDEERLWKVIKESPYFFKVVSQESYPHSHLSWAAKSNNIWFKRVRAHWEVLNKIVSGEKNEDVLPSKPQDEIASPEMPSSDVPFHEVITWPLVPYRIFSCFFQRKYPDMVLMPAYRSSPVLDLISSGNRIL